MSGLLTRTYLRTHYWITTGAIIVCLIASLLFGGLGVIDVQADARYTSAFAELTKAENWFQVQLAWASNPRPVDHIEGRNAALKKSFGDLLATFIIIRSYGGDGSDLIRRQERSMNSPWGAMASALHLDLRAAKTSLKLGATPMPAPVRDVWRPIETLVADILVHGYAVVNSGRADGPEHRADVRYINEISSNRLRPALHSALASMTFDSLEDAHYAFRVLLGAGLTGVAIALASVFLIHLPVERSVLGAQRLLVCERDKALASEKAKRDFLAMMSHELRTPMNGILGFSNLLLSTALDEKQKDYAETIHSSGITLLDLLNDLLDISKIESGAIELESEEFAISDIVTNVITLLGPRAFAKRLDISAYMDPSLPEKMRGDAGRLRQILLNLVNNAIKFTSNGGVVIEVRREGADEDSDHSVLITVSDSGIGIPSEQLGRIFERFTQVDASSSRNFEGAGLGLPICRQLVELMGGQIGVESAPGKGSSFWVRLTLANAVPPAEKIGNRLPVDLDQMMPEMDGVALRNLIRQDPTFNALPLALSSSGGVDSDEQAIRLGFDAICPKFATQEKLVYKVHELLNAQRSSAAFEAVSAAADTPDSPSPTPGKGEMDKDSRQKPEQQPAIGPEATAGQKSAIGQQPRKLRLLVAEDNAANQRLILAVLEKAGYAVDIVADGVEAVHAAQRLPYDLILMDIRMPVMGGIEATRRIRSLNLPIAKRPILALTANAMVGDREEYLAAGMNDYISKPIDLKGLVAKIKRYLEDAAADGRAA